MTPTIDQQEQSPQAGAPLPPVHPHLAAVWGAFLHEGMMLTSNDTERTTQLLELWGNGTVELINSVCEFIPLIWDQVQPYWHEPQGFPGVFEYEVVSILGEEIATHMLSNEGNLPTDAQFTVMVSRLVTRFFSRSTASSCGALCPTPIQKSGPKGWLRLWASILGGAK